ncbi:MAG: site-2 protease family protein [Desulfomonilaceae bacterium]|nr:site-2 protease family protein [Desulfomonilaceae bacterium]
MLLVMTLVTTTFAGAWYVNEPSESWIRFFLGGWVFSLPLMAILLVHEMGHYIAARRRFLDVSPPYFIPAIPPVGTFGAFIKIRSPIPNKRVLMEVGASGPIAGSLVAVPLLVIGSLYSEVKTVAAPVEGNAIHFGTSLVLELLLFLRFGDLPQQATVFLHPTAMAAWFGLFITALNLLPLGQLDGGHVVYALFGPRRARIVSLLAFGCLIPLGIWLWLGWLLFGTLALFIGLRHPPPLDSYTPLDRRGRVIGWTAIIIFAMTFIPAPITITGL